MEQNTFILEVKCNITIKGKYTAVGRLLLFPINGEGDAKIKIGEKVFNAIFYSNAQTIEAIPQPYFNFHSHLSV